MAPPAALTAAWTAVRTHTTVPLAVLATGFTFSLAANVTWTWDGGPIRVAGGALASLALPGAIHLWPRVPTHGRWLTPDWAGSRRLELRRLVRAVVMTLIAALAAVTTFSHASELLAAHGETWWLAMAYPIITELVVVMAALAHRADIAPAAEQRDVGGDHSLPDVPGVDPAIVRRARALLDREPSIGRLRLQEQLEVSEHYAKALLRVLRPVQAVAG